MLLIKRAQNEIEYAIEIKNAHNWWARLVGLLGTGSLNDQHALWLKPCGSIHTIGMRYAIDVVFLDRAHQVRKVASNIRPFSFCFAPRNTRSVVELAAGTIERLDIRIDDQLVLT